MKFQELCVMSRLLEVSAFILQSFTHKKLKQFFFRFLSRSKTLKKIPANKTECNIVSWLIELSEKFNLQFKTKLIKV